jgi:endonuclease/exonuclease/phosphatase (EEP) superfamily protein YafD
MAKSFNVAEETFTGVATGSRVKPMKEEVIISDATEPISGTRKTILLSQFLVQWQAQPLLVANIHAINFVTLGVFKTQIKQLLARVREHEGPLIVAGDFNTWNTNRMNYLKTVFAPLGLTLVDAPNDRFLNLDHVFVRGLKVQTVNRFSHIRSSDHTPLKVNFIFDNSPLEPHENIH